MVTAAGLVFQGWSHKAPYGPHEMFAAPNEVYPAINALLEPTLWSDCCCAGSTSAGATFA
jgi:hypothetical protein